MASSYLRPIYILFSLVLPCFSSVNGGILVVWKPKTILIYPFVLEYPPVSGQFNNTESSASWILMDRNQFFVFFSLLSGKVSYYHDVLSDLIIAELVFHNFSNIHNSYCLCTVILKIQQFYLVTM